MLELFDDGSIVMSLGKERLASRMNKLGMTRVEAYQLRADVRKSNDAVKKGIASPLPDKPDPEKRSNSMFFDRTLTKEEKEVYDRYSRPLSSVSDREFMKTPEYQKMLAKHNKKFQPEVLAKKQKNRDELAEQRERKREARKAQGRLPKSATSKRDKKDKAIEERVIRAGGDSLDVRKAQLARFASDQSKNPKNLR